MAKYGLTPQGPNPKRLDVILEDMHSKMTDRLGVNTRQNPQSLLNHILTNVADEIAELWEFGAGRVPLAVHVQRNRRKSGLCSTVWRLHP